MSDTIRIRRPDDWHLHLRDNEMMAAVLPHSAKHFGRAIVMPNLVPPVVTQADAVAYKNRILEALKQSDIQADFKPLMTLYLTESTQAADVMSAHKNGIINAVKLYPAGATTNSASGVSNINNVMPVLEAMAEQGIILCMHGEVTTSNVDIFDREKHFLDDVLQPLKQRLPELKVVLEHITTKEGVDFVKSHDHGLAGTITTHHLMLNRNHMLVGGIRPHYYCLPIIKRESHRKALVDAACSGDSRFFLGTDSAPHVASTKENACGCAGVFNAPNTMSCLAQVFEEADALSNLEKFASINGAQYYGLPVNEDVMVLEKRKTQVAALAPIEVGDEQVVVFEPVAELYWHVVDK